MEDKDKNYKKLIKLHDRLKELKGIKKSMNKDYAEQIKEVEGEIEDLVEEIKLDEMEKENNGQ